MGIGISVFLIALGAVLSFAVNLTVSGLELDTIGVILMVVGAIGLVASLVIWGGWSRPRPMVDDGYVEEPPAPRPMVDDGYVEAPPRAGRRVVRRGF